MIMKSMQVLIISVLLFSSVAYSIEATNLGIQDQIVPIADPAPTKSPRIVVRIGYSIGFLEGSESVSWTQEVYQENAAYSVGYDANKGNSFNFGIGYRFSSTLGVDIGLDMASRDLGAINSASIPHPLYFNSPREADNTKGYGLKENAAFLNLVYSVPFGKLELDLFAGPAYFMTSTELTNSITFTESAYPYDTVSISSQSETMKKKGFGFNAGSNLNFYMSKGVAVYVSARYLSAKANFIPSTGIPALSLTLGGLKLGGGLKILF
jgi:opacity protein-like surface antigen